MITIETRDNRVEATVFGEFTLADFREFEEQIAYANRFHGPVRLLLDLRQMLSYTIDVAWEELKFTHNHPDAFDRIAIVTDDAWLTWIAWLERFFVDAEIRTFTTEEEARVWLDEPEKEASATN
ncbi:hypothetical protein JCM16106_04870 [Hydrogenophilus islandicus]